MNVVHDIHIIEKTMSFKMVPGTDDEWITGDWYLRPGDIDKIDGGNVLLHLTQKAGCHFGGTILSVKAANWGKNRVEIRFRRDPSLAGQIAESNWAQDNAIIPRKQKAA